MRKEGHEVAEILGGRRIHPVDMVPGGISKRVSEESAARLREIGAYMVEFAQESLAIFDSIVLQDEQAARRWSSRTRTTTRPSYLALVNKDNQPDAYDGDVRIVDADGHEVVRYAPQRLPRPHRRGDRAVELPEDAVPEALRLARRLRGDLALHHAHRPARLPQRERQHADAARAGRVRALLRHLRRQARPPDARVSLGAPHRDAPGRRAGRAASPHDERLTSPDVRTVPSGTPREGVGTVEAPRGLLTHHYITDENGIVEKANLIVGTTYQYPAIQLSVAHRRARSSSAPASSSPSRS